MTEIDWVEAIAEAKRLRLPTCQNCGCICDPDGRGGVCACDLACAFCSADTVSACVYIERDGLAAGVYSRKHRNRPELPGGKLEDGETPEQAAAREILEELGVHVYNLVCVLTQAIRVTSPGKIDRVHRCYVFVGEIDRDAEIRGSAEGDAGWFSREYLLTHGTYRDTLPELLEAVDAHRRGHTR